VVIEVELSRVNGTPEHVGYPDYNHLFSHGLRARLEIQSFVTGQLMVALDFYPDTQPKLLGIVEQYPELPTLPAAPGIAGMLDAIPIKQISRNLQEATAGINKMLNAEWTCRLDDALKEITLSARAVRLFMEYLEQHPEALLKGKTVP
jgi:paraquat-inducible protein B